MLATITGFTGYFVKDIVRKRSKENKTFTKFHEIEKWRIVVTVLLEKVKRGKCQRRDDCRNFKYKREKSLEREREGGERENEKQRYKVTQRTKMERKEMSD